jgi:oligosaccharide repeat unit polymerase
MIMKKRAGYSDYVFKISIRIACLFYCAYAYLNGQFDGFTLIALSATISSLDLKSYFSISNIFIIYTFLLFDFAGRGYYFPKSMDLFFDHMLYLGCYLGGVLLCKFIAKTTKKTRTNNFSVNKIISKYAPKVKYIDLSSIEKLLVVLIFLKFFIICFNILKLGPVAFYSGQLLAEKIQNYSQGGVNEAVESLLNGILITSSIATVCLYIWQSVIQDKPIRYSLMVLLMVFLPIIGLERSSVMHGIFLIGICISLKNRKYLSLFLVVGLLTVLLAGLGIGFARASSLAQSNSTNSYDINNVLDTYIYGELSGVFAYSEIKEIAYKEGFQNGKTMFLPFILKPLPRSLFQDKPFNSSAYYTFNYYPDQAKNGFFFAPTLYGDIFLNFGYFGCATFSLIFGFIATHIEKLINKGRFEFLPYYLIFYYGIYFFMRNNLSDTIFNFTVSCVIFIGLARFIKSYTPKGS